MTAEESIVQDLITKFPFLEGRVRAQRSRRITADVDAGRFEEVFEHAMRYLEFTILCTITGLDEGPALGFIYHMARTDGTVLSIRMSVPKDRPVINSVIRHFPCAEIYERELIDLLGAQVGGLSPGNRYPLPDSWPKDQYPLRKDWKPAPSATADKERTDHA